MDSKTQKTPDLARRKAVGVRDEAYSTNTHGGVTYRRGNVSPKTLRLIQQAGDYEHHPV